MSKKLGDYKIVFGLKTIGIKHFENPIRFPNPTGPVNFYTRPGYLLCPRPPNPIWLRSGQV